MKSRHYSRSFHFVACEIASGYGAWRLKAIKKLIGQDADRQRTFEFTHEHPLIRSMEEYGSAVAATRDLHRQHWAWRA